MARRTTTQLRAVPPGGQGSPAKRAASKKPAAKTIAQAVKSGTKRDLLVAIRDRIATVVARPDCPAREVGALLKQLQDVASQIETLDDEAATGAERANAEPSDDVDDSFDASAV